MTQQQVIKEYLRCKKDPAYFIKHYVRIKDSQTGEELPFDLWGFQEEYVRSFKSPQNPGGHRFHLVLKSRQLGMSTVTLALLLHKAIFQNNAKIVIVCKKLDDSSKMLTDELYFMLDNLPTWMKPKHSRNKTRVSFHGSYSWIMAAPASPGALRQYQASHVVFDEFAFYNTVQKDLDGEMFRAAWPSLAKAGFCTIISTPDGMGNMYADMVQKARANELPKYWFKELSWRLRTERLYNEAGEYDDGHSFKSGVLSLPNGKRIWDAEYGCEFLQSGSPVFSSNDVFLSCTPQPPITGESYVIGADIASGSPDGDFLVAQVLRASTGEQVLTYRTKMSPKDFGSQLNRLGRQYNNALMGVERNNMGVSTLDELERLNYPNMYRHTDGKLGFLTSTTTKPEIIFNLDAALKARAIRLSDETTKSELLMFQHKSSLSSGGMGAPNGRHDDTVMSLAISFYLMNNALSRRPTVHYKANGF